MPQIEISKIKLRRGTNAQRKRVIFDQGEIVSTTDTKRVFIGTGSLSGGFPVGSKVHPPLLNYSSLSSTDAEIGDLVNANNKFYQLISQPYTNISNWRDVGLVVDTVPFSYSNDNTLILNPSSISAIYIDPDSVSNGLYISNGVLQTNFNTKSLEISSLKLSIKASGIDEREINSSTLSQGLTGGSGSKIRLNVDSNKFYFSNNTLSFHLSSTTLTDVDNRTIVKSGSGVISLSSSPALSATNQWPKITVDQFGRVISTQSSILDVLTGNASLSNFNSSNSLSALYNGDSMGLSAIRVTQFTALSSDGVTIISLSSAGFITFEGNTTTRNGSTIGRFAIPIYRY
jgi:hypothetical protein